MSAKECAINGSCTQPEACADERRCVVAPRHSPPLILTPMSDWRENPFPYPVRCDTAPRAVFPQGVDHA